ncbi:hypothetical protein EGA70_14650 [Salmonella enterica]|nr:hypothetical protein [Salmonella enterica]
MNEKNKLTELIEHKLRWYYRLPVLVAIIGVFLAIASLSKNDYFLLVLGGCLFFIGLGAQWVLGFEHFILKRKK